MRSIGIFGGTFDPPHSGHIDVARAAADNFALSEVWWTPVGRQPLKTTPPQAFYSQPAPNLYDKVLMKYMGGGHPMGGGADNNEGMSHAHGY